MILPASQAATLALLLISLICWGTWANTLKLAGKWRCELYFYDFALGFALLAVVAAFTGGTLSSSELTFQENFLVASYRNLAYVLVAGAIFNVGNLLLTATVSVAGMALAFSVTSAVALTVDTVRALIFDSPRGMLVALAGAALLLAAAVLAAFAYSQYLGARAEAVKQAALQADPRAKLGKRSPRAPGAALPVTLAVVGGLALGLFHPLLDLARAGDNAIAPYGLTLLFAASIFGSTVLLAPFFFTFPVTGAPISFRDYFSGTSKQHLLGLLGGILAGAAFLSGMLALGGPRNGVGLSYGLSEGGPVLAVICGLLIWSEFKGAGERPRLLMLVTLILLAGGIALLAIARG
jgi:glucose uptake protein